MIHLQSNNQNANVDTEYLAYINSLKQWITTRQAWFNEHIGEIGDVYDYTLTYEVDSKAYQTLTVKNRTALDKGPVLENKENETFAGWVIKDTETSHDKYVVYSDLVFTPVYMYSSDVPDNNNNDNNNNNNIIDNTPEAEPKAPHNSIVIIIICSVAAAGLVGGTIFALVRSRKNKQ